MSDGVRIALWGLAGAIAMEALVLAIYWRAGLL